VKHSCEVEIGVPRARVVELFDDPAHVLKWQPDLLRFEPISGKPGHPGAQSRLVYGSGKGEFEMIETITDRQLPDEFSGLYETRFGITRIRNRFVDNGASTRWIVDTEYLPRGIMRLLAPLMRRAIEGQTMKIVNAFKRFAESQPAAPALTAT
jgi:hypothetical protein